MKPRTLTRISYVITFAALAIPALANTTWYVNGVSGSDSNNCLSVTSACKTIGHAISLSGSGDSIKIAAATYKENLTINISLSLIGSGASGTIIDGEGINTVVTISSASAQIAISRVTVAHGYSQQYSGGGIVNAGILMINAARITGNRSRCFGGGIANGGVLTINKSTISENSVSQVGACRGFGGGIGNRGTLTLNNSTISRNTGSGTTGPTGGGIYNTGSVTVNNSTISGNVLAKSGTFYGTDGGGITNSGTLKIRSSTISANGAQFGGNLYRTASMRNSIIANPVSGGNCHGTVASEGYNLSSDGTCDFDGTGDLNNTDPLLGPLQNNGGPTQTMALLSGSPAIDSGNPGGCTDDQGHLLKTDQRGEPRPDKEDSVGCDMGAYESQSVASGPVLTGYCAAPSYPRCAVALDLTHCPAGQPARGVLSNECGKYSAWSLCNTGLGEGKCLVQ
jgi:hypothetical protein